MKPLGESAPRTKRPVQVARERLKCELNPEGVISQKPYLISFLAFRVGTNRTLGFLAYIFPNDDPEDALVKLLERARKQAIRRAERQIRVLHPGQESEENREEIPEKPVSQGDDRLENPIGELQELCQKQQISLPRYEFSEIPEGFACAVQAMGLHGNGEGPSKKDAKTEAARRLLELVNPN